MCQRKVWTAQPRSLSQDCLTLSMLCSTVPAAMKLAMYPGGAMPAMYARKM